MMADRTRAILPMSRALPAIRAIAPSSSGSRAAAFSATASSSGPRILAAFFFLPRASPVPSSSSSRFSETSSRARPVDVTAFTMSAPFRSTLMVCVERKDWTRDRISCSSDSSPVRERGAPSLSATAPGVFTTVTPSVSGNTLRLATTRSMKLNSLYLTQDTESDDRHSL
uniref:Uncharacterized protein n=1 Tax=Anopheles atroparvus TaxID=41427 RepID=A0AAG5D288_ANOAO